MENLFTLVKESRVNEYALATLIEQFEPKIKKVSTFTSVSNREDLEQELKQKLILCIRNYEMNSVPGFFEYKNNSEVNG
ncbi:helix-turn-helix domain-containing protein [Solibacillus sp. CAU 1738]|uniref:helix-turn-helix domain-containing protein n=1 Tax=Solibacillus sp. CAU 1738 TaxID=3140363 RepID=UPI0032604D73